MTVKNKATLTVMLLIASLSGIFLFWSTDHCDDDLERAFQGKALAASIVTREIIASAEARLRSEISSLLGGKPGVAEALANRDRDSLLELFWPTLERLRKEHIHSPDLTFHLPNGRIFLRGLDPGLDSENAAAGPTVMHVHATRKGAAGHESRAGHLMFLVAQPVFLQGEYVGAVELGIDVAELARRIEEAVGAKVACTLETSAIGRPRPAGEPGYLPFGTRLLAPLRNTALFSNLLRGIDADTLPLQVSQGENTWALYDGGGLVDSGQAVVARLLLAQDITQERGDLLGFLWRTLALTLGLLAATFMVLRRGFGAMISKTEELNRSLEDKIEERTRDLNSLSEKLRHSNMELDQIFNSAADGMRIVDRNFNVLRVNDTFSAMARIDSSRAGGGKCYETFRGALCRTPDCPLIRLQSGQERMEADVEKTRQDGSVVSCILTATPFRGLDGELLGIIEDFKDITVRKGTLKALRSSEERYRTVADHIYDWESWISPEGRALFVSPACERITGHPPARFLQEPAFIESIIHKEDLHLWRQQMKGESGGEGQALDFRIVTRSGEVRWVSQEWRKVSGEQGDDLGIRTSIRDITDRKIMEQQLTHQALHDPLTGLANRSLCVDRIRRAVQRAARREDYHFAVVFVDLDRFKSINDGFGHSCGDALLMEFSQRIAGIVRSLDTVARFGGDEFVILLEELPSLRRVIRFVKRVREALASPFTIQGYEVRLTASFGIAFGANGSQRPEDLLQKANIAMHRAKEMGRDRIKVFNSRMLEQAILHMTLENDMRRAIARNEFSLVYQPIYSLREHRLVGFEALLRWEHPDHAFSGPGEFIPLAEETGLIIELGKWALREACSTLSLWRESHAWARDLKMSVNISPRQFSQADLVQSISHILRDTDVPPDRLRLEITETAIMDNAAAAVDKLHRLKGLGIAISVDDFGTGYSSMAYLQRFPLDILKIDLSFVRRIETTPENRLIVKAIISLAHSLGLQVVAEGIEKEEHRDHLTALDCEFGQGFFFSQPLPYLEAEALVARGPGAGHVPEAYLPDACITDEDIPDEDIPDESSATPILALLRCNVPA
ncbi:MAG: EAL domain-containing protein [Thermodesulfobacteriota bacterium]